MSESKNVSLLATMSFGVLLGTIFLLPLFFIPGLQIPLDISKGMLFSVGTILSFILWLISRLVEGTFVFPKDPLLLSVVALPVVFFIAALFSPKLGLSLFGYGFEVGTAISILTFSLALFLSSVFFQDTKRISYFFLALLGSFSLVILFELAQIFFGVIGSAPGFFSQLSSLNLVGSWNEFGAFAGLITIVSLLVLELLPLKRTLEIFLWVIIALSLLVLALVNFFSLWMIVGIMSLVIFAYAFSASSARRKEKSTRASHFPAGSFTVVLISLLFIISNNFFGGLLPGLLGVSNVEIRPSVSGTFEVIGSTLSRDPLFGSGPNRFSHEWFLGRPDGVSTSDFWDSNFNGGFSLFLTFIVTTGIVGGLAFLGFIGLFFFRGIRLSTVSFQNSTSSFVSFGSFMTALYLWILTFAFVPNVVLFGLAFVATGVFIGVMVGRKDSSEYVVSFLGDPRLSFFSILLIIALIIGSMSLGLSSIRKFSSIVSFEKSVNALRASTPDFETAESKLLQAIALAPNDFYYRSLSEVYLARLSILLDDETLSEDVVKEQLQAILSRAEQAASSATQYDSENYLNWVALGFVYESIVPLGVENAYASSKGSYEEALERNPTNPGLHLNLARLEVANKDIDAAKEYITKALEQKPNYLDAFYLLSRIALAEDDTDTAIIELEKATVAVPGSADAFFQLGVLRFNDRQYAGAVSSFERTLMLSQRHLDARYLLALSYERLDREEDAKTQLMILQEVLPENTTIADALTRLEKGQSLVPAEDNDIDESDNEDEE